MSGIDDAIGRDEELAALKAFVAGAGAGPAALVVTGEAGIGKTTLWQATVEHARAGGLRVLTASPAAAEAALSFGAVTDLLDGVLEEVLAELPAPQRHALEVALLLEEPAGVPPDDRAVAAAFLSGLARLAATAPVLVAVDDTQWLDPSSAHVLAFAARRLRGLPVGLLLAERRGGPASVARLALEGSPLRRQMATLEVGPLSLGAVHRLLHQRLGFSFPRPVTLRLHDVSGGNPFFALELARALQRLDEPLLPGDPLPIAASLDELVRARLESLPEATGELLLVAAALSQPTTSILLEATPTASAADLDRAVEADVLAIASDRVRFTHPLVAAVVYSAAPARRRELHRRLAGLVDDHEERARHLARGTDGQDERVASKLERAARRAADRGALPAAAELTDQALRRTPTGEVGAAHRRRLAAADRHFACGNAARARLLLEEGLPGAEPGTARAELLLQLGRIENDAEDRRVARVHYRRAAEEPELDDGLRARILVRLAAFESEERARAYALEAAELAERTHDPETLAAALATLAMNAFFSGERLELETIERALALEPTPGAFGVTGPSLMCAEVLDAAGLVGQARPLLERLYRAGQERGDLSVTTPLIMLAELEINAGHWSRAAELAREAHDLAVQGGREVDVARTLVFLGYVAALRGEAGAARELAAEALELTQRRGLQSRGPRGMLGLLELSLENYAAAYNALLPAVERNRALGVRAPFDQPFDAVEALVGLGRLEEARDLLAPVEASARTLGVEWALVASCRARGLIAAASGEIAEAERILVEAVTRAEPLGQPLALGRTLLALGSVQRRGKRRRAARTTLERARTLFDDLGAALWTERARAELARIGGRTTSGELTPSERRVAELVSEGRSNKEVAAALFLAPKTVDVTLSRIYLKLGIHSRTELARQLGAANGPSKL